MAPWIRERSVPPQFGTVQGEKYWKHGKDVNAYVSMQGNCSYALNCSGDLALPLRVLDEYAVVRGEKPYAHARLTDKGKIMLRGYIHRPKNVPPSNILGADLS